jgi:hypothetical protein
MTIKASGRAALILAAGLFVCFAGPSQAATGANDAAASSKSDAAAGAPVALNKYAKHGAHHLKKLAHRKSSKVALKSASDKKAADVAADDGDNSSAIPAADIPPSVANANAQLATADAPSGSAKAMAARANSIVQAAPDGPADKADNQPVADTTQGNNNTQLVAADQLNDVDRSLHANSAPATTLAMASADAPVATATTSNESSTWDQTSLIGKIFIGFGALLTMASAARMFMA